MFSRDILTDNDSSMIVVFCDGIDIESDFSVNSDSAALKRAYRSH